MAENATYTPSGNSNYIYGQANNAQYYGSGNYGSGNYGQGGSNDSNDEEESNFNIMEWVMLILHY